METIKNIVEEYEKLYKDYSYLGVFEEIPKDWRYSLTVESVAELRKSADWLVKVAEQFADKLNELENSLQPLYGTENTVLTVAEYVAQGWTEEQAERLQVHNVLYNKYVNGQATPDEIETFELIAKELDL